MTQEQSLKITIKKWKKATTPEERKTILMEHATKFWKRKTPAYTEVLNDFNGELFTS